VHCKGGSSPLLDACSILGNKTYYGGGVDSFQSSPVLVNCVVAGNLAVSGGAAFVSSASSLTLAFCTLVRNSSEEGPALANEAGAVEVRNCILLENSVSRNGDTLLQSCLLEEDPFFRDRGVYQLERVQSISLHGVTEEIPDIIVRAPDFRLTASSPAIDMADGDQGPELDLAGLPRPQGGGYDIGAYEFEVPRPPVFRRGDCNDDGVVDLSDAVCILSRLFLGGPEPSCLAVTNVNEDAIADLSDAVYLLSHLFLGGPPPPAPFPECGPLPEGESLKCAGTSGSCGN
jgi:hypothetical protein